MVEYTFKKHALTGPEKMWLLEASAADSFDPKIAKVKLFGRIPVDFDPNTIDSRLYANRRITPIGRWLVDPESALFKAMDASAQTIRKIIFDSPGIEEIGTRAIAAETKLDERLVGEALSELNLVGEFFTGSYGPDPSGSTTYRLMGDRAYDAYIRYSGIDDVLERRYLRLEESRPTLSNAPLTPSVSARVLRPIELWQENTEDSSNRLATKRNTAFVIMAMDPMKPELVDVYETIKDVCGAFSIRARRVDEIQQQGKITDQILDEIQTCEFLIADLSFERPNVYYEIGYAHAANKRPILFRKAGTPLHFDLVVHRAPEYKNVTELRELLKKTLEAILGRQAKPE